MQPKRAVPLPRTRSRTNRRRRPSWLLSCWLRQVVSFGKCQNNPSVRGKAVDLGGNGWAAAAVGAHLLEIRPRSASPQVPPRLLPLRLLVRVWTGRKFFRTSVACVPTRSRDCHRRLDHLLLRLAFSGSQALERPTCRCAARSVGCRGIDRGSAERPLQRRQGSVGDTALQGQTAPQPNLRPRAARPER